MPRERRQKTAARLPLAARIHCPRRGKKAQRGKKNAAHAARGARTFLSYLLL